MSADNVIEVVGVGAGNSKGPQLSHCSLAVRAREIVAVVGGAGAGKSMILEILAGRRKPKRGISQLLGLDTSSQARDVREVATHIPQGGQLDSGLTLRRQLAWWAQLLEIAATPQGIRRALRDAEIPDRYFDQLGGGVSGEYRVLTWLALAQLRQHRVLLIDDPVRSASLVAAHRLTRAFHARAHSGAALLLVTRDIHFAEHVADRVFILEAGQTRVRTIGGPTLNPAVSHPQ